MPKARAVPTFILLAAFSWFAMQWLHESGHIVGCVASGGTLDQVVLAPWSFSRTDTSSDPHPLLTTWSGPFMGTLLPLCAALVLPRIALLRILAAFCLLANGAYLFFGTLAPVADAATLLRHGAPRWSLFLFGAICLTLPFPFCLHRQNNAIHWRPSPVTPREQQIASLLLLAMLLAGTIFFRDHH